MILQKFNCYMCDGDDCDPSFEPFVCENAIMCWKSMIRDLDGTERGSRGCIYNHDQVPFYCNQNSRLKKSNSGGGRFQTECCKGEVCNGGSFPILNEVSMDSTKVNNTLKLTLMILGPILGLTLIVLVMLMYCQNRKKNLSQSNKTIIESGSEPSVYGHSMSTSVPPSSISYSNEIRTTATGDSTIKQYLKNQNGLSSGSGAGLPLLVQRTLAKQVHLTERLSHGSSGSFGREVWRGVWHGENVAVKIFCSRDETIWIRETEIYSLLSSRHDNILGYLGSDMTSRSSCTQLLLVTNYHPHGSLYNYLSHSEGLDYNQMFLMCLSITQGLLYLHTEIQGTRGKPAIAHCNIKSKNILVKLNGTCVISDLANAVTQIRLEINNNNSNQGSIRYMSPEQLEDKLDSQCLESFRRADIYSMSLVFWEICRKCISGGVTLDYAAPYSEWLDKSQVPTLEKMRQLVVDDKHRPSIPNHWHSDQTLDGIATMIKECWHAKAAVRLPILRIKKKLVQLASNNPKVESPCD